MHQIRYFLAVCETLNFTRAAEACNVSQPSLTRAIKGLEDELGGPLFRRERNNTHLTGLGEMMRPHLTQVLIETDAAKERAKSFAKLDDVELKLGMMCTIGPRRFVPFLQAFRERHPKVRLIVQDGSNSELQERLAQGELDVAVYGQPEEIDERFHARRLYDERFVIGVGPGHPFDKQNAVRVRRPARPGLRQPPAMRVLRPCRPHLPRARRQDAHRLPQRPRRLGAEHGDGGAGLHLHPRISP